MKREIVDCVTKTITSRLCLYDHVSNSHKITITLALYLPNVIKYSHKHVKHKGPPSMSASKQSVIYKSDGVSVDHRQLP